MEGLGLPLGQGFLGPHRERGSPPSYLSLLVDLAVPSLGAAGLSSNRFLAFDLVLGAPSDLAPPSSERPG